jgi:shikimate kinase
VVAEGEALLQIKGLQGTVVSLTGSNPLAEHAMQQFLAQNQPCCCIFLDVDDRDVLARLEKMKVSRIVGQNTRSMAEILQWRRTFYERCYDMRLLLPRSASPEQVSTQLLQQYQHRTRVLELRRSRGGLYESTRSPSAAGARTAVDLPEVVLRGLAPDGGLYLPQLLPHLSAGELERLAGIYAAQGSYADIALRVLERLLPELSPQLVSKMAQRAYRHAKDGFLDAAIAPLVELERQRTYILELFQGPTARYSLRYCLLETKF